MPLVTRTIDQLDPLAAVDASSSSVLFEVQDTSKPLSQQSRSMTAAASLFTALKDTATIQSLVTLLLDSLPIRVVADIAELKGVPSSPLRKMAFIIGPTGGASAAYTAVYGSTATGDDVSVITPTDGLCRYLEYPLN